MTQTAVSRHYIIFQQAMAPMKLTGHVKTLPCSSRNIFGSRKGNCQEASTSEELL